MFTADINKSVSAYFGPGKHEELLNSLGIMENLKNASDKVNGWCATCGLVCNMVGDDYFYLIYLNKYKNKVTKAFSDNTAGANDIIAYLEE